MNDPELNPKSFAQRLVADASLVPNTTPCLQCKGEGVIVCEMCEGEGQYEMDDWSHSAECHIGRMQTCIECEGEPEKECIYCEGTGEEEL